MLTHDAVDDRGLLGNEDVLTVALVQYTWGTDTEMRGGQTEHKDRLIVLTVVRSVTDFVRSVRGELLTPPPLNDQECEKWAPPLRRLNSEIPGVTFHVSQAKRQNN